MDAPAADPSDVGSGFSVDLSVNDSGPGLTSDQVQAPQQNTTATTETENRAEATTETENRAEESKKEPVKKETEKQSKEMQCPSKIEISAPGCCCGKHDDSGVYVHEPKAFNADVYYRADGHFLYWYPPNDKIGSWRTAHDSLHRAEQANPQSPYMGSGEQYPRYKIPVDRKYIGGVDGEWSMQFEDIRSILLTVEQQTPPKKAETRPAEKTETPGQQQTGAQQKGQPAAPQVSSTRRSLKWLMVLLVAAPSMLITGIVFLTAQDHWEDAPFCTTCSVENDPTGILKNYRAGTRVECTLDLRCCLNTSCFTKSSVVTWQSDDLTVCYNHARNTTSPCIYDQSQTLFLEDAHQVNRAGLLSRANIGIYLLVFSCVFIVFLLPVCCFLCCCADPVPGSDSPPPATTNVKVTELAPLSPGEAPRSDSASSSTSTSSPTSSPQTTEVKETFGLCLFNICCGSRRCTVDERKCWAGCCAPILLLPLFLACMIAGALQLRNADDLSGPIVMGVAVAALVVLGILWLWGNKHPDKPMLEEYGCIVPKACGGRAPTGSETCNWCGIFIPVVGGLIFLSCIIAGPVLMGAGDNDAGVPLLVIALVAILIVAWGVVYCCRNKSEDKANSEKTQP